MIVMLSLLLSVVSVQDSSLKRRGEFVTKLYEVSSILRAIPEPSNQTRWSSHIHAPDWRNPEENENPDDGSFWPERDGGSPIRPEDLLGILRACATPTVWTQGDASMDVQGGTLFVEAPPSTHEEIARLLPGLDALLRSQEVFLRVDVLVGNEGALPPGPVLDAGETQKLAARLDRDIARSWGAQGKVFSGYGFVATQREKRSFLRSYEVEVATKSKGTRPVVGQALTGPAVSLRPFLLNSGGRVLLSFVLEDAALRSLDKFETRSQDAGTVQIPRVDLALFAGSAVIGPGESLLVSASGEIDSAFWVRVEPAAKAGDAGDLSRVDPRFLFDRTGRSLPRLDSRLAPRSRDAFDQENEPFTADLLAQIFPTRNVLRERSGWQRVSGGFFVQRGPGPVPEALKALEASHADPVLLDLVIVKDAAGTKPVLQAHLSVTPGRICGFWGGVEASHVAGYEIQIAQESTIAQPVVVPLFDGLQFRARILARQASGVQATVELATNAVLSAETVHSGLSNAGDFVTAVQKSSDLLRQIDLPWGTPVFLGELGPISEATRGERLFATLRARQAGK